ncbi:uncharacterized protein PITG_03831 [Phytophthora infestans T30-4]|uniref:Rab-GAP TBC domain-containing protein n=1 Tax=Phytophthora infestans (strain T30-4) TaxID=403677 RepID=D0MYM6_PHYIT|nr:uncharacterized protein PITG_03831 [Phytophthora infestans T30-4]EEY66274.1 conserved hypothetical protein [Phytophthora infestans T30-4]|eukprot:XP_002906873.1 conserved hypothetical protein [Phytophthora infestans T30-4]
MVPAELVSISTPLPNARRRHHSNCDLCEAESPGEVQMDVVPEKKRQLFWRNVVKQFNFTDQSERELLLSLTGGISWTHMRMLPKDFMRRHREIYYLISTPEYERSGAIGRDVTRTFSIFERSHQHQLAAQQSALFRVLNAIAEAEDGYCQGMNFIAALFLVEGLSEADAYALFLYMLKKRHLAGIYHRSSTFLDEYLQHFELMFIRDLPKLHAHMLAQGFAIPISDAGASSSDSSSADGEEESASTLSGFGLHRTLSPDLADAIRSGNGTLVRQLFEDHVVRRHHSSTASVVLANEILHFAIWYGRVSVACLAIERCNADVDNRDDSGLTPLHFSVIRNQPDMETSMRKLSPLELAHRWKRRDTTAARLVLEKEELASVPSLTSNVVAGITSLRDKV